MKKLIYLFVVGILVSGCANPGIVKLSPDTYMLSRVDHGGIFGNAASLKAGVIRDANTFAESQGKIAIPLASQDVPMVPGGYGRVGTFASFEYQFRVVDKNDPEARRTSLVPRPDIVIDKTEKVSANIRSKDITEKQPDLYTELTKLDDLQKKGILTDEEFQAQKKRLLEAQR
ncbi:MAG: hypothetical protein COX96_08330 [Candidatus Omnitrophica bacterium CG_4_10_14_0_2_um_filter_44_9]|nr:MAG: hypothetical protein COX96_08330 [Candidatus Omnitrophica bacterium CG_4_10_14_0_2_um_filter_44_9]